MRPVPEWWVGADDANAAAQAASALPGVTVLNREAAIEAAADDPYWRGSRTGMLAAALGAVLLALVGLMVDVWATARRRLGEFAVLHTLGATPRLMARALLAEQTFLAGIGVGVGLLLGTAVGATMAPLVILTPAAGRPITPGGVRAALGADRPDRGRSAAGGARLQRVHRHRHPSAGGGGAAANRGRTMSVGAAVRRVRAYGGQFLLLAVLTLVVTLLISGVPRLVNRLAEQGLRAQLNSEPAARRDISYTTSVEPATSRRTAMGDAAERFDALAAEMPPPVRSAVTERWYSVETAGGPRGRAGPGGPQPAGRHGPAGHARHTGREHPRRGGVAERDLRSRPADRGGARRRRGRQAQPARRQPTAHRQHRRQGQTHRRCPAGGVRAVPPRRPRQRHLGRAATAAADHRTAGRWPAVRHRRRRRAVAPQQAGRGGLADPVQLAVPTGRRPDRRTRAGPADRRPSDDAAQPADRDLTPDPGRRRPVARVRRPDRRRPDPARGDRGRRPGHPGGAHRARGQSRHQTASLGVRAAAGPWRRGHRRRPA